MINIHVSDDFGSHEMVIILRHLKTFSHSYLIYEFIYRYICIKKMSVIQDIFQGIQFSFLVSFFLFG